MTYAVDFQIDLGSASSGLALTATITTMAGAAVASGVGGWTEYPASSGVYWGTLSNLTDGTSFRVIWLNGSTLVSSAVVSPGDARIPVDSASIALIQAKTDRIGTRQRGSMSAARLNPSQGITTNGSVSVTTSPQQVVPSNSGRLDLLCFNNSTLTFYLAPTSGLTVANGYPFPPQTERSEDFSQDALWVVATASGADLRWWETRLGR